MTTSYVNLMSCEARRIHASVLMLSTISTMVLYAARLAIFPGSKKLCFGLAESRV